MEYLKKVDMILQGICEMRGYWGGGDMYVKFKVKLKVKV